MSTKNKFCPEPLTPQQIEHAKALRNIANDPEYQFKVAQAMQAISPEELNRRQIMHSHLMKPIKI